MFLVQGVDVFNLHGLPDYLIICYNFCFTKAAPDAIQGMCRNYKYLQFDSFNYCINF